MATPGADGELMELDLGGVGGEGVAQLLEGGGDGLEAVDVGGGVGAQERVGGLPYVGADVEDDVGLERGEAVAQIEEDAVPAWGAHDAVALAHGGREPFFESDQVT